VPYRTDRGVAYGDDRAGDRVAIRQGRRRELMRPYRNFALMILVACVLMFCLMYLNTYQVSHVWFSQARMFMTFIMGGSMALVMLSFMRHMYTKKRANLAIVIGGVAFFRAPSERTR
jgi:hypothetical protein